MSLVAAGLTSALGWLRWSKTEIIVILFSKWLEVIRNPQNLDSGMLEYPVFWKLTQAVIFSPRDERTGWLHDKEAMGVGSVMAPKARMLKACYPVRGTFWQLVLLVGSRVDEEASGLWECDLNGYCGSQIFYSVLLPLQVKGSLMPQAPHYTIISLHGENWLKTECSKARRQTFPLLKFMGLFFISPHLFVFIVHSDVLL